MINHAPDSKTPQTAQRIFFDHDAGVDDLLSLVFLMGMNGVDVAGVGVTPADCYIESGLDATLKILARLGRRDVPVAAGTLDGRHAFPHEWRVHSDRVLALPMLRDQPHGAPDPRPAHVLLADRLRASSGQVTALFTGPLTNLAAALEHAPDIEGKIARLVWMGGAFDVPGNVHPPFAPGADGTAEWNVYWDAAAAARVWQSRIPITMVGLDATDKVPVSRNFLRRLDEQRQYPLSELAAECWELTANDAYHLWDTLTTLTVGYPDLVGVRDVRCSVVVDGPGEGRTARDPGGRVVQAAFDVDPERVYQTVLDLLRA